MLIPFAPDWCRIEKSLLTDLPLVQQILCPVAQRSAKPNSDWNTEAGLGSFDEGFRDISIENLTQQPLALTFTNLPVVGKRPDELKESMIEVRCSCLQAYRHGRAIYFY